MDRGFCQYLTEYNNSNDEADEDNILNNFEALIISIDDAQELKSLENIEYFLISFSLLTCDDVIQVTTYLVD